MPEALALSIISTSSSILAPLFSRVILGVIAVFVVLAVPVVVPTSAIGSWI